MNERTGCMKSTLSIATAILLAGCSGTEPARLRVSMTVDKTVVAVDDSVRVSLNLVNASRRTIRVLSSDAYDACYDAFEVYDAQGRQGLMSALCIFAASAVPGSALLAPGETLAIEDWWRLAWTRFDEQPISPGTYHIRGRAVSEERDFRTDLRQIVVTN